MKTSFRKDRKIEKIEKAKIKPEKDVLFMSLDKADVVVIGGGIIGLFIAYFLGKENKDVVIVEKEDIAFGASGACDQNIFLQSKPGGLNLKMALRSKELYYEIKKDLGEGIEFENNGGIILIENEKELSMLEKRIKTQRNFGLEVELISREEIFKKFPRLPDLSSHILGASYSPHDAHVNPIKLCHALSRKIKADGGRIYLNTPVRDIISEKTTNSNENHKEIKGVVTTRGKIMAANVVNACGVHAPGIGKLLGLNIPIYPRRGQIVLTQALPNLIEGSFLSTSYLMAKENEGEVDTGLSLSQTRKGNLLIGATREFSGYDASVTREGIKEILKNAVSIMPFLQKLSFIRSFSGLRPYSAAKRPFLGSVGGIKGFFVAAGHEGDGISMAPVTGKILSQLICGKSPEFEIEDFSLDF